jgi:hypothetical protein
MKIEVILLIVLHCIASYLYVKVAEKYEWFEIKESDNV